MTIGLGYKLAIVGGGIASLTALLVACGSGSSNEEHVGTPTEVDLASTSGALIKLDMGSTVGVLLDEIPAGPQREQAAANALAAAPGFWIGRAGRQLRLTNYRLVFRGAYYAASYSNDPHARGPLPLPPESTWRITLSGAPTRTKIDGHDLVVQGYTFGSYILTDSASPGTSDPNLASVGGTTSESFALPIDPELLFQRTGYACMDEDEFPPNSVFEENTYYYYDDSCTASDGNLCHVTAKPKESCKSALTRAVGSTNATLNFSRVAYDPNVATQFRVGTVTPAAQTAGQAADLAVVPEALTDERAIAYRFFAPGSCELGEGVIGKLGWRRVLMFSANVRNDGTTEINLGNVTDPANPYVQSNAFEFSACHGHYHFSHYGVFTYADLPGSKRAFCLEDTNRYHNDETTPLTAPHQSCSWQGITRGWGDEYNFGIPGQWVDITDADTKKAHDLTFTSNNDQFLCEGVIPRDAQGNVTFDPTSFTTADGKPVTRIHCNFLQNWDANNKASTSLAVPAGSFVTDPCKRGQVGPSRDCGFRAQPTLRSCNPGSTVTLTCTSKGTTPQVLRVCEKSAQLGVGVACTGATSAANVVVGTSPTPVSFVCPAVRDAAMVTDSTGTVVPQTKLGVGGYSLYEATMGTLASDDGSPAGVTCTGF